MKKKGCSTGLWHCGGDGKTSRVSLFPKMGNGQDTGRKLWLNPRCSLGIPVIGRIPQKRIACILVYAMCMHETEQPVGIMKLGGPSASFTAKFRFRKTGCRLVLHILNMMRSSYALFTVCVKC